MKIENRITCLIVFLLVINLFYFKIAKNIFEGTSKVIESQYHFNTMDNLNTNKNQVALLQTNEPSDIERTNQEVIITNKIQSSKTTDEDIEQNTNDNQEDIIDEIGNNISEGGRPFPLNNGNLTMIEQSHEGLSSQINTKLLDINKAEISEEIQSKHLVSFIIILIIVTAISLSIIAYQEYKSRKRINQFNMEVGDNQGYYLLSD